MGDDAHARTGDASTSSVMDVDSLLKKAMHPGRSFQAQRLRDWKSSGTKLLDLRPAGAFAAVRFANTVNIPFRDLDGRLHELPPRSTPMAVLLDQPAEGLEDQSYINQLSTFAADFKQRPWNVTFVFVANPGGEDGLFDTVAKEACVEVQTGIVHPHEKGRLWEPSDMVARWLPRIEANVPSAEDEINKKRVLVDLGCGAGRDAVFAALRGWHVLALDSDAKGLQRCAALARTHGVEKLIHGQKVDLNKLEPAAIVDMARRHATGAAAAAQGTNPAMTAIAGAMASSQSTTSKPSFPPHITVLAVRYMNRPLTKALPLILPVGAAVCWFHFLRGAELTAIGRPNKAKDLLERGELRGVFETAPSGDWDVLCDGETVIPDGRPVSEFIAKRRE